MRTKIATVPLVLIAFLCGGAALDWAYARGNRHGGTDPRAFESTAALGEVTPQYRTDPALLKALGDPEAFNVLVYEKIFNAPLSDLRLGLSPANAYGTRVASKPKC